MASGGDIKVAKCLVSIGADVNATNSRCKRTPLDGANFYKLKDDGKYGKNEEMVQYLESVGGKASKDSDGGVGIGKVLAFVGIGLGVIILLGMCGTCMGC
jgi:hypothetical protein